MRNDNFYANRLTRLTTDAQGRKSSTMSSNAKKLLTTPVATNTTAMSALKRSTMLSVPKRVYQPSHQQVAVRNSKHHQASTSVSHTTTQATAKASAASTSAPRQQLTVTTEQHLFSETMVKKKSLSRSPHEGWQPVSELVNNRGNKAAFNQDLPPLLTDMCSFIKSDVDSSTSGAENESENKKGSSIPDSGATVGQQKPRDVLLPVTP